ncbi:MAG: hypothetical protein RIR00_1663 [Pseudomonadota bacterium]
MFANNFHFPPARLSGDSLKWNKYAGRDVLPLWVADMDFPAPPAVIAALQQRVAHGVFGYAEPWPSLLQAVQQHLRDAYRWEIEPDWLVWLPGLVSGLNVCCRAAAGEVLTATPIYPPFLSAPRQAGQAVRTAALRQEAGVWGWDWPAMTAALTPATRLLLLCHPHNPVGRCWRDTELAEMADFVQRHDLLVCSDEIHCGLILDPARRHRPLASLAPEIAARSITLMAPSKTFNVPGLGCAFAVIPDAGLRRRFLRAMAGIVPHVNVLGLVACEAALRDGEPWRQALLGVLRDNAAQVEAMVGSLPQLAMSPVEATYLAWIDARGLGVADPAAHFEAHGLGLSDGKDFAAPGWVRLNFGCAPDLLAAALDRLRRACG